MTTMREFKPDWNLAPGEILLEVMDERGISIRMARALLRMSGSEIVALLNGEMLLTDELAGRLEEAFGVPALIWRNLEGRWRQELPAARQPRGEGE